jgi:hypothetical protein
MQTGGHLSTSRASRQVRRQLEAATGARGEFLRTVGSGQGGFTEGKRLKRGSHREKSNGRLAADHNSRAGTATGRNGSDHRHREFFSKFFPFSFHYSTLP